MPRQPSGLLTFVALEREHFSAQGLDASVSYPPSGKRALEEALFAGQADIAWANEAPVALAGFKRNDFRIVATMLRADNLNKIIARGDSGIARPEDLRGKRIATRQGSSVHFFLPLFLLEEGLGEKDVLLSFRKAEERLAGNAGLFEMPDPYAQIEVMLARQAVLARRANRVRKALQTMVDAASCAIRHPHEAVAIASGAPGVEIGEIERLWPSLELQVSPVQPLPIVPEYQARWAIEAGLAAPGKVPDYPELIHSAILRKLKPEAATLIQ